MAAAKKKNKPVKTPPPAKELNPTATFEREVLALREQGYSLRDISRSLELSLDTVYEIIAKDVRKAPHTPVVIPTYKGRTLH